MAVSWQFRSFSALAREPPHRSRSVREGSTSKSRPAKKIPAGKENGVPGEASGTPPSSYWKMKPAGRPDPTPGILSRKVAQTSGQRARLRRTRPRHIRSREWRTAAGPCFTRAALSTVYRAGAFRVAGATAGQPFRNVARPWSSGNACSPISSLRQTYAPPLRKSPARLTCARAGTRADRGNPGSSARPPVPRASVKPATAAARRFATAAPPPPGRRP
jgi:hypothetical protein